MNFDTISNSFVDFLESRGHHYTNIPFKDIQNKITNRDVIEASPIISDDLCMQTNTRDEVKFNRDMPLKRHVYISLPKFFEKTYVLRSLHNNQNVDLVERDVLNTRSIDLVIDVDTAVSIQRLSGLPCKWEQITDNLMHVLEQSHTYTRVLLLIETYAMKNTKYSHILPELKTPPNLKALEKIEFKMKSYLEQNKLCIITSDSFDETADLIRKFANYLEMFDDRWNSPRYWLEQQQDSKNVSIR